MAERHIEHQDAVRRLQQELKYAQQATNNSTQNGQSHHGSAQESEALREAHDELTIVNEMVKETAGKGAPGLSGKAWIGSFCQA
jgi:hypothetical protein